MRKQPIWWGYIDLDEKIHIKRYKGDDRPIRNAEESGTTVGVFEPFHARNIEEAAHMILEKYREVRFIDKRIIT